MAGRGVHACGPFVLMWLLVGAACGASDTRVRDAASAEYRIRRDVLWSEIVQVVRQRYPKMQIASLDANRLVTQWMETHYRMRVGEVPTGTGGGGGLAVRQPPVQLLVRVTVTISGVNPYRIGVDVQAAVWWAVNTVPSASRRTDDMPWVAQQRDELVLAIHDRLKADEDAR